MTASASNREMKGIGERLERLRSVFNLTQKELAGEIGVAQNRVNQWEREIFIPSLDGAVQLREKFGITLDWLYFGDVRGMPTERLHELSTAKLPAPAGRRSGAGHAPPVPFRARARK